MRSSLPLGLFLCFSLEIFSQEGIRFEPLPKGISQGSVTKIVKDQYGFLWFGTRYGLNKFDGISYQHFPRKKDGEVFKEGSYVRDIELDENGDIWIATEGSGVLKYDYSADTFHVFKHNAYDENSISANASGSLLLEGNNLWIGIKSKGINRIDFNTNKVDRFWSNIDDDKSLSSNHTTAIERDNQGNIWIGTWSGLSLYSPSSSSFTRYDLTERGLQSDNVVCMFKGQNFWLGLDKGLARINYRNNQYHFEPLYSQDPVYQRLMDLTVLSMAEDADGNLWIGTENGGLFYYNISNQKLSQYQLRDPTGTIISNSVWSLLVDDLGILWAGTFNGGVVKVDPNHQRMKHVYNKANLDTEISQNMVSSFAAIDSRFVWVGTDGGGLNRFDLVNGIVDQKFDLETHGGSNAVLDVLLDKQGDLWLATWGGMMKKQGSSFITYTYNKSRLELGPCGNQLFDLMEDDRGNIWAASFRAGISVYLKDQRIFKKLFQSDEELNQITSERPTVIYQDSNEDIWIGTEGDGLYKVQVDENYDLKQSQLFEYEEDNESSLSHNIINIIFEDQNGVIWVGTEGGGLNRYDKEDHSFKRFTKEDGLSSNLIYAIAEDDNDNLWLSTNNGLSVLNTSSNTIRIFDETDGAQSSEFIKGAAITAPNGDLLFGGIKGFNHFTPGSFTINNNIPDVFITSMEFETRPDHSIYLGEILELSNQDKRVELEHEANDFIIDYAILNYSKSTKNQIAYMLKGYDDQWIEPSNYQEARYTNVPPGNYEFQVRGSNNDGKWNEEAAVLKIHIKRPWWNTTLAYIIYTLLIGTALFGFGWLFIKRERLRRNLTIEHIELEKMKELDSMKSRFFANISHEFRTPLTLIISPLKSMIDGFFKGDPKNQYKMMARNADRLLSLINQLLDLSKLEAGHMQLQASRQDLVKFVKPIVHSFTTYAEKQYIDYKCTFPEEDISLFFEKDKLEKIIVNLLSNAFKYTQEFGKIDFSIVEKESTIQLIIEDSGIGMSKSQLDLIFNRFYQIDSTEKKGTGIGLALTKELVELHKGVINVTSTEGEGTKFVVELRKGGEHLSDEEKTYIADDFHSKEKEPYVRRHPMDVSDVETVEDDPENENLPIVLVVDDNEDIRLFISEHLISNYRIMEAEDGEKALKIAQQEIPDIIISDVMMPRMDGYELCKALKLDDKTCHIPFILLTAKASNDSALKGFEIGADNYVTKPFNPKLLELRVRNILQSRENLKSQLLDHTNVELAPSEVKVVSKDKEFLRKLIEFIELNMSNSDLSIDDVCKEMGLSRTQLYRKLKGLVGQSANELIRSIRLKRAAQLIKSNEMTISEITYEVGFNDLQYFRFCFKKQFGVNPSEYGTEIEA
ncbi:two-component regulator propeller domain-containing protein [Ekhidna sp.]